MKKSKMHLLYRTSKSLLLFTVFILFANSSFSQKYSNEFLNIGVGARAQAMGNAFVASVDDVTAGFWNPAALASLDIKRGIQVGAMHSEQFGGVGKYDYLGVAIPFDGGKRALGITAIRFGIDDIPNTLSLYNDDGSVNYDNVKPFSAADYGFLTSYSQYVYTDAGKLYLGGNVKVVRRTIGPFAKSWGFGIDAAVQYHRNNWRFGALFKDITTTFNAWQFDFTDEEKQVLELTDNAIPIKSLEVTRPALTVGAAYKKDFGKIGLLTEMDMTMFFDGKRNVLLNGNAFSFDPNLGMELNYGKFVFLRAGVNNIQKDTDIDGSDFWTVQPNIGVGVKIYKLRLDYAFTDIGDNSNQTYSHVISLLLDLDFDYLGKQIKNAN